MLQPGYRNFGSTQPYKKEIKLPFRKLNVYCSGLFLLITCPPFLIFFFFFTSQAQILTNYPGTLNENAISNNVFFSEKFIRQNKIKSVKVEISFKRELQPIVKTGNSQGFEFNLKGKLVKQFETILIGGNVKDTLVSFFIYNENNLLELKRSSDGNGFYSYYFDYDNAGNIIKQVYSRDENKGNKNNFVMGRQFIISSETYQYEQLSVKQKRRKYFNDNGLEYKSVISSKNDYGNITEEESRFIVSDRKSRISYKYDEYFRLIEKTDYSAISGQNSIVSVFNYDDFGNLLQEKISYNGKLKTTREFLYDNKTFLLDAQLIKDEATQTIQIYKYNYELE